MTDNERETMYAIRRTDGGLIYGEWAFIIVDGPDDWDVAEVDAGDDHAVVTYEMVRMTQEVVGTRTLPECAERCGKPVEFWGLCEEHAREDDPETLAEMLAERSKVLDGEDDR
jgi:hypothetical protein